MKRAILFAMTGLCILGWCVTGRELAEKPARFRQLVRDAEQYETEKIYVRAIETYKEALEYQPESLDLKTRIASDYLALGDESSFINQCNAINKDHNYPISVVTLLSDYYIENKRNDSAINVLQAAMEKHKGNEELSERFEKVRYTYTNLFLGYDEILPFRNDSAVVIQEGKYGLLNTKGKTIVKCVNDGVGALSGSRDAAPVYKDGEYYYANSSGYRIEVPQEGQSVDELGVICNGVAPAKINGTYGYINVKFEEQSPFAWDGATVIQNDFGAVRQGGKWALIDSSYEQITDFIYDDVKTDVYDYCSIAGRAFVKNGSDYQMVNEKGETVGEGGFEDAVPFAAEEPTAVMKNGKWGFVALDGQMVIDPQYEDAGAFSGGLAPVKTAAGWGYITLDNRMVIADEFTEAESFYKGVAPVKNGNSWTLIQLNVK